MSPQKESGTDDDDLFEDAVGELTTDINTHLNSAREELPDESDIWEVDAPNVLGALNALKGELDIDAATIELREARKNYVLAERADAFDDDDSLGEEITAVADLIDDLETLHDQVADLTGSLPELKSDLEDVSESSDSTVTDANADNDESKSSDADEETDAGDDVEEDTETTADSDANKDVDESEGTEADDETEDDDPETDSDKDVPIHSPPAND